MPEPKEGEKREDFLERCIPVVLEDGTAKDSEQAVAICSAMFERKSFDDDMLIQFGDAVKAERTDAGLKVGGYLVRFTGPDAPDLTGEYFTGETDFDADFPGKTTTYFNHGMDAKVGKRRMGRADLTRDDVGIWAETILQERDAYEKFIAELALAGKLGWSSGSVAHLVEKDAGRITYWPIAEASLTHTPAEPRNGVLPLKSLIIGDEAQAGDDPAPSLPVESEFISTEKVKKMTPEDIKALVAEAAKTAVEEYRKSEPASTKAGVSVITDEADQPFKSAGEFFMAVKNAALYPSHPDRRLLPLKAATGMGENVPADGGYLVSPTIAGGILERMYKGGEILSRCTRTPIGPNSNGMIFNGIDETSRVDGSRYGGLLGYWMAEGSTKTASAPKFRQVELKLHKVAALAYATDELLADATALESWLTRTVPEELRFRVEDAIYNGDGVGKPLGIMSSNVVITQDRDTAGKILFADIANMWSRRWAGVNDYVWFVNQDTMPQLLALANSSINSWWGNMTDAPVMRLLGRPVIEVEQAASLNTTGDIMLASMSQYQVIDKGGVQSASSIHVQFLTDQTVFRFVYRVDGQPLWSSALTPFKGSATQSPFVVLKSAS